MSWASSPRKGGKAKKDGVVAWAAATAADMVQQHQHQLQLQQQLQQQSGVVAPYSSNGISPFSSNNSGTERQRKLDMDPEAVSHVSCFLHHQVSEGLGCTAVSTAVQ